MNSMKPEDFKPGVRFSKLNSSLSSKRSVREVVRVEGEVVHHQGLSGGQKCCIVSFLINELQSRLVP